MSQAWHEVPAPPAPRQHPRVRWVVHALAALVIGPLGPFVRTLLIAPAPAPVVVATAGLAALWFAWRSREGSWPARLGVAAVAGAVALPFGGLAVGLWLAGTSVLAAWVALDRPPWPGLARAGDVTLAPVVVLAVVATWRGARLEATVEPLVLVLLAGVTALALGRHGALAERSVDRLSAGVRRVAEVLLLTPLWLVTVVAPWLVGRALRVDPLRAPVGPDGLVRRRPTTSTPDRLWVSERARDRLPRGERWRRRLLPPVIAVALLGALVWSVRPGPRYDNAIPPAMADSSWWPAYRDTVRWYEADVFDTLAFRRQPDVQSPHFNVRDQMRVTWRAPGCSCPRIRLWIYGGSTVFGFGQRDEHTIASELARLAQGDGLTLDVDNRGVSGDTHWVEATRFAWDVAAERPPDLVLFYDGVNDLGAAQGRNGDGRAAEPLPIDATLDDLRKGIEPARQWFNRFDGLSAPDGVVLPPAASGDVLDPEGVGRAAVARFELSRELSRHAASDAGVPVVWFWQPSAATRPASDGEPSVDEDSRTRAAAAAGALDPDVVDLTDSLDGAPGPLFYDEVHTNERGARLVAEAIYAEIRDQLIAMGSRNEG
ncbi:MAG: hypothetical protein JWM47_414 [Acidimicrobiales bacterium]|nr:hypothetical protein [Acidimicrobiales bacterium]